MVFLPPIPLTLTHTKYTLLPTRLWCCDDGFQDGSAPCGEKWIHTSTPGEMAWLPSCLLFHNLRSGMHYYFERIESSSVKASPSIYEAHTHTLPTTTVNGCLLYTYTFACKRSTNSGVVTFGTLAHVEKTTSLEVYYCFVRYRQLL